MTWIRRFGIAVAAGAVLVACSSSPAANTSAGSSGTGRCNEPCVLFDVSINFSGLDSISGSFVDDSSGEGFSSCADFAKGDSVGWVLGPGTVTSKPVVIDGKSLNFGFTVTKDKFHGPGTYSAVLAGGGVTIGADTFFGTNSSETLKADGSGQGSFAGLEGGSVTGAQGTESGTVNWTCTK